jgi:acetyl-CoA carboxylase carboxyl transferase subunit alpha
LKDYLEFEKPIAEIEEKLEKLRTELATNPQVKGEIRTLEEESSRLHSEIFSRLTAWERTQLARHPNRPNTSEYVALLIQDFTELHGDRLYGDDHSILSGIGMFHETPVIVIGHQKGKSVKERVYRNFGMPHPEGYRKALRVMKLAERFGRPILTFIDTPGAYPGLGAEERGQSEAIARNLLTMASLKVPILTVVIGEGGSGGALALGVSDRILMLEHAVYSVISPEGCAAILWDDQSKTAEAAEALRMTAKDLKGLSIIDEIVPEPPGGAHRDPPRMAEILDGVLQSHLTKLLEIPADRLLEERYQKFRRMGVFGEEHG